MVITGNLNLEKLRPDCSEGTILLDLEEVHDFQCLIPKPTRITKASDTLLDVILTTKPEIVRQCGVINPKISGHYLIYGMFTKSMYKHKRKIILVRTQEAHTICLCSRLLFYSKCIIFTICLTYIAIYRELCI